MKGIIWGIGSKFLSRYQHAKIPVNMFEKYETNTSSGRFKNKYAIIGR